MNLETLTLQEQIEGLREKKFSSVELVKNYISVIEDKEDLNIFVSNDFEKALEKAKKSDESKKSQEDAPLNGIPIFVLKV
jgi:Asp-tRNA(Asn)/Glu-tRNA(Gln) amidotransferase A subunit family amidase